MASNIRIALLRKRVSVCTQKNSHITNWFLKRVIMNLVPLNSDEFKNSFSKLLTGVSYRIVYHHIKIDLHLLTSTENCSF